MFTSKNDSKIQDELDAFLRTNPIGQMFISEKKKKLITLRTEALSLKKRYVADLTTASTKKETILSGVDAALTRLEDERKRIYDEARAKLQPLWVEISQLRRNIQDQDVILSTNSEPGLDEAIIFFTIKIDELRKSIPSKTYGLGDRKLSGSQQYFLNSNMEAISMALQYCRDCLSELENMKLLQVEFDAARVEKIKSEIPDVSIMSENSVWLDFSLSQLGWW